MASKTVERIVHYRMMPGGLVGYQADIEADEFQTERTIHFSGPFEVTRDVGKYCSPPYSFSHAVFDYNTHSESDINSTQCDMQCERMLKHTAVVWLSKGKPEEELGM